MMIQKQIHISASHDSFQSIYTICILILDSTTKFSSSKRLYVCCSSTSFIYVYVRRQELKANSRVGEAFVQQNDAPMIIFNHRQFIQHICVSLAPAKAPARRLWRICVWMAMHMAMCTQNHKFTVPDFSRHLKAIRAASSQETNRGTKRHPQPNTIRIRRPT